MSKINLRQLSIQICNVFEDLLDEYDIDIPNEDREGEEGEAHIYGDDYYQLEDDITEILANFMNEVKITDTEFETHSCNFSKIVNGVYYVED